MAFKKIRPRTSAARLKMPVAFGAYKVGKNYAGAIRLNQSILDRLDWELGFKVEVSYGTGDDAGEILLTEIADGERGFSLISPGGRIGSKANGARIAVSPISDGKPHDLIAVEYDIDQKKRELYITLPSWAADAIKKKDKASLI